MLDNIFIFLLFFNFYAEIPENQIRVTIFRADSELGFTRIQIILIFSLGQIDHHNDRLAWEHCQEKSFAKLISSQGRIG